MNFFLLATQRLVGRDFSLLMLLRFSLKYAKRSAVHISNYLTNAVQWRSPSAVIPFRNITNVLLRTTKLPLPIFFL